MNLSCYPYKIPFRNPFTTGSHTYLFREGFLFELEKSGIHVYGEAAPLPAFSRESIDDVQDQLKSFKEPITALFRDELSHDTFNAFYTQNNIVPSLQFAFDTLAYSFLAARKGLSLRHYLFDKPASAVPVNAVIPLTSVEKALKKATDAFNQNFQTLKVKINGDFGRGLGILQQIRSTSPESTLRIDANQSWEFDEAIHNLQQLEDLNIEFCEEPLPKHASPLQWQQLSEATSIPLALDETLIQAEKKEPYVSAAEFIILKPMILGSFSNLFATKALADTFYSKAIFTTSLESGIGRMITATLASGLGQPSSAHGLHTGPLLAMDVWQDGIYINNGHFNLPKQFEQDKELGTEIQNIALTKTELYRD